MRWLFWHKHSHLALLPSVAVIVPLVSILIWILTATPFLEAVGVGIAVGALVEVFVPSGLTRYRRRYIRSHDYCVCPKCGYPLSRIGDKGACPECGTPFNVVDLREHWQSVL